MEATPSKGHRIIVEATPSKCHRIIVEATPCGNERHLWLLRHVEIPLILEGFLVPNSVKYGYIAVYVLAK